jgi:ariadne-1
MIFLKLEDIKKLIDKKIESIVDLLGTDYDEALILYHHFKWSKDQLENSDWFSNPEDIRVAAGLIPKLVTEPLTEKETVYQCGLCLSEENYEEGDGLICRHRFCKDCWTNFVNEHVKILFLYLFIRLTVKKMISFGLALAMMGQITVP